MSGRLLTGVENKGNLLAEAGKVKWVEGRGEGKDVLVAGWDNVGVEIGVKQEVVGVIGGGNGAKIKS